jgi:plasmid stabilization system protein ParE
VKRRPVYISSFVEDEILRQVLYIAEDSIDNALAWEDRLRAAMKGLGDFQGHAIDDELSNELGYPVHKLVFEGTYLIHYRVDDAAGEVRVVRFRHGARLPRGNEL